MKKSLCVLILLSLLTLPVVALAEEAGDACAQAIIDAERDVNGTLWLALGCLLPIIGLAVAYLDAPSPPATALLGKTSDYVVVYTDCYKLKGQNTQIRKALIGLLCVPSCGIALFWL